METHIVELVSNASMDVYPDNSMASFTNFLPEQFSLDGKWEVAVMEISYPALYNNVTSGQFRYKKNNEDTNALKVREIPPGFYKSINEILIAMKHVAAEVDFSWKINGRDQKVEITLPSNESKLNIISPDLAHILGFPLSFLVMGVGPHRSIYPVDILRVHSLMIYTDIIEYGIIGDTKAPLLRCFPFITKLRNSEIQSMQYMNYRTFEKLQFKKLMMNSFHSIGITIRDHTGEVIPFVSVGYTRLTLLFRKISSHL